MNQQNNSGRRGRMKGRPLDPAAQAEIQALLGDASRRRDLLIEHLHKIQDRFGHISAAHIVALAREMKLATAEIYEVATFYHHFDVVKEGDKAPPAITVRVCDSLSCEMAGAQSLLGKLKNTLGMNVRVIPAPCVGRCEQAPVAVVGQNPLANATPEKVAAAVKADKTKCAVEKYTGFDGYRRAGGYNIAVECLSGKRDAEDILKTMESSSLRGLGGAGFPTGRKWRILRGEKRSEEHTSELQSH